MSFIRAGVRESSRRSSAAPEMAERMIYIADAERENLL